MSRRSSGEGTISLRSDGRWEARIQVANKRTCVYGKTRQEVAEKLRILQGQAERNGRLPDPGKLTLANFLSPWLEQAEPRLRPKTQADYATMARLHVAPTLGTIKLSRLQPLHVAGLYAALLKAGLSKRRVGMVHGLLHKVLSDAFRWGLLPSNPADSVEVPKRESQEPALWTPEQIGAFLQAVQAGECGQYGDLFAFLLASGCREGEALGLLSSDLDWKKATIRIEKQVTWCKNRPLELTPKSRAGVRTIALPPWGLDALRRQKAQTAEWRLRAGQSWAGGERIFTTETGTPPSPTNLRRSFHIVCARLGLPPLRLHDLRAICT